MQNGNFWWHSKPAEAEGWPLYRALKWIGKLGYQNVIFESDCKMVVDNFASNSSWVTDLHVILSKCIPLFSNLSNCKGEFLLGTK